MGQEIKVFGFCPTVITEKPKTEIKLMKNDREKVEVEQVCKRTYTASLISVCMCVCKCVRVTI